MVTKLLAALSAVVCVGSVACAAADESSDAPEGASADEIVTGRVKSINVYRGSGFVPPAPPGQCRPSGSWTFDFEARALSSNACIASTPTQVDKVLSEADASRVRTALSKVRVADRPSACPTDMPVSSLQVIRARSQTDYVDARAACGTSSTPVRESTLAGLVSVLEELSAPATSVAPCVRGGCSGEICADDERFSICIWRPEFACYQAAVCERGADGQCGFRQTPELAACLGSN